MITYVVTPARGDSDSYTLEDVIAKIDEYAFQGREGKGPAKGADLYSYLALKGKLGSLKRTGAFDVAGVNPINTKELLVAGQVSVFDVSYSNERVKNVVIADVLKKIFERKVADASAPKTLIVIEEAHTFISREKRERMEETIETVREIARRGRKRWLSLCLISQQPSHLPNELFELCNTRIVHNIKSQQNLSSLRLTVGDVSEEMWNNVPLLGTGQAVISSPQFRDPLVVNIRPCKTQRKFTV